jgi:hypothetical protein
MYCVPSQGGSGTGSSGSRATKQVRKRFLINERETPENIACISLALERHWKVAEPPLSRKEPDSPGKLAIRPLIRPIMGIRNLIICPIGPKTAENQAAIVVGSEVLHVKNLLRTCLI